MDERNLGMPRILENARLDFWLPGDWPSLTEMMKGLQKRTHWEELERFFEERERWVRSVKTVLRSMRIPLLRHDVYLGFVHRRCRFAEKDRLAYSHSAERFILPGLLGSGAFGETMVRGVTHVFRHAEPSEAGIQVLVAEHVPQEQAVPGGLAGQGILPGMGPDRAGKKPGRSRGRAGKEPGASRGQTGWLPGTIVS